MDIQTNQGNIDLGEAEAIILALELRADLLLMDERRSRALATSVSNKYFMPHPEFRLLAHRLDESHVHKRVPLQTQARL